MSKRVAILQSSYIPWKGYFDIIKMADEFILFDDVQFTKRDWRNRNKIKTVKGAQWLTIPVETKSKYDQLICDTEIANNYWHKKHWSTIMFNYSKAPYFNDYKQKLEGLYQQCNGVSRLSDVNLLFLRGICDVLRINTPLSWSMDYGGRGTKTDRLVDICNAANADIYLSGPSARDYLDPELFAEKGIKLEYMDYSNYRPYRQDFGEFDHFVSVIDLIFNEGAGASQYMKSFS